MPTVGRPAAAASNTTADNLAINRHRAAVMRREFEFFNGRFEAAGVVFAALKGFALVPDFCPDAALRLQYDYDYLVRPDGEDSARRVLQRSGYSRKIQSPGHEPEGEALFASEPLSLPAADQDFYAATLPRRVELHVSLWEPHDEGLIPNVPAEILDRTRWVEWQGLRFPTLADDDALLFQLLHAFKHMLACWCRLSCFHEIAFFMAQRQSDRAFWGRFRSRIEKQKHLPEIAGLVFSMASTLFGAVVPEEATAWSSRRSVLPLWVREFGERWAMVSFPGSKLTLFVHGGFVADPGVWKSVRRNRLLPLHQPAQANEGGGAGGGSRWKARRDQCRFVLRRAKFHLASLLNYAWQLPHWKRVLRRALKDGQANRA